MRFPVLNQSNDTQRITSYLSRLGSQFKAPNKGQSYKSFSNFKERSQTPKPTESTSDTDKSKGEDKYYCNLGNYNKCGKRGHFVADCQGGKPNPASVNVVTVVRAQSALDSQLASLEVIKHAAWKPPQSTFQGEIPPFWLTNGPGFERHTILESLASILLTNLGHLPIRKWHIRSATIQLHNWAINLLRELKITVATCHAEKFKGFML
ncbi:hypothetical protein DSO57_1008431 [Entomophthora muscae]|uniref:Uncharacterized protein n=1 Tax=Entomophthora muscae TaxID=34485 RepID=A0ACC2T6V2_9FUNG|nr:hypothetical protein DSO57_1008431 [Entomophthora muscae]